MNITETLREYTYRRLETNFHNLYRFHEPNWDGEGAEPVKVAAVQMTERLFRHSSIFPRATLYPCPDGTVSARWTLGKLEIIISVDGSDTLDTAIIEKGSNSLPTCRGVEIKDKDEFEKWWFEHPIISKQITEIENAIMNAVGVPKWAIEGALPFMIEIINGSTNNAKYGKPDEM